MRVVVTGASGSVGTAPRRVLAADGVEVIGVARRVPGGVGASRRPELSDPSGKMKAGDPLAGTSAERDHPPVTERWVGCDIGAPAAAALVTRAVEGADAVVHLARAVQPTPRDPDVRRTNLTGSAHVLRAAERAGVPHVVVASSVAAHMLASGPASGLVDEGRLCGGVPGSAYSAQEAEPERLLDGRAGDPAHPARPRDRAFNVAADPVLRATDLAAVVGGFLVPVPFRALPGPAWLTWRFGSQPAHPGRLRPADRASLVDTGRPRGPGWALEAANGRGRGTRGPLAPHGGPRWSRLGRGRPVHQSQGGGSR
ncbi:NAD-dependent epimerase/dehydratase family protein [Saccharothrix lopnurensis]|uniref:NAD-dependent epimerase/dehydratase family protein n=1 Tax=Saccharothrix lopnurensis TaxID=1670621 RepID=A0ABW1PDI3_9PSEU